MKNWTMGRPKKIKYELNLKEKNVHGSGEINNGTQVYFSGNK
jgi:hypothetical protein